MADDNARTTPSGVHYTLSGVGPALVFIHGAGGNAACWFQQAAALREQHTVVCLDLPGFGRSPPRPLGGAETFAAPILEVMDHAGVSEGSLVCQSLGGWFGLRTALTAPERVRALVLCCTMAGIAHAPAVQAFLAAREKMGAEGPARLALSDAFEMRAPEAAYLYRQITAFNPPLDPSAGQVLFSPEVLIPPAALGAVRAPVLLLNGALDPIWPPASVADLPAHFPDARQLVLPDTGHSPYFEAPAAFNAAITAFLDQTASK